VLRVPLLRRLCATLIRARKLFHRTVKSQTPRPASASPARARHSGIRPDIARSRPSPSFRLLLGFRTQCRTSSRNPARRRFEPLPAPVRGIGRPPPVLLYRCCDRIRGLPGAAPVLRTCILKERSPSYQHSYEVFKLTFV
jgi:hypothetical protein